MIFKITPTIEVSCQYKDTRNGFKHTADLYMNGEKTMSVKVNYTNRTWEKFEFDTVLLRLAEKAKLPVIAEFVSKRTSDSNTEFLSGLSLLAGMFDIFADSKEEKNKSKKAILKAGLGDAIDFPEDFDSLPEDEQERRLNGAIKSLK